MTQNQNLLWSDHVFPTSLAHVNNKSEFDHMTLKFEKKCRNDKNWHIWVFRDTHSWIELLVTVWKGICYACTCVWPWPTRSNISLNLGHRQNSMVMAASWCGSSPWRRQSKNVKMVPVTVWPWPRNKVKVPKARNFNRHCSVSLGPTNWWASCSIHKVKAQLWLHHTSSHIFNCYICVFADCMSSLHRVFLTHSFSLMSYNT